MNTFKPISIEETKQLLDKQTAQLLDIRDEATFKQGHIPGAYHLTRDTLADFMATQAKDKTYIVCCYRGNSSKQVAQLLCDAGFSQVYNLEGGFTAWHETANEQPDYDIELDA